MKLYFSICVKFIVCLIFVSVFASAALSDSSPVSPPLERWAGKITGMAEGTWVLNAWRVENTENELMIKGDVKMIVNSVSGGYGSGNCDGTVKGKIKNGVIEASFFGTARVTEGETAVSGTMNGGLTENKGAGTYNFFTRVGNYSGEWTLQKD